MNIECFSLHRYLSPRLAFVERFIISFHKGLECILLDLLFNTIFAVAVVNGILYLT